MLTRILEKLGFQLTADVWEANERLKAKLSLAEKRLVASETNVALLTTNRDYHQKRHYEEYYKYLDACKRIIELEIEVNVASHDGIKYPQKGG